VKGYLENLKSKIPYIRRTPHGMFILLQCHLGVGKQLIVEVVDAASGTFLRRLATSYLRRSSSSSPGAALLVVPN